MNHKGQNIVEYILLVAVVVVALIIFHRPDATGGPMKKALQKSLGTFDATIKAFNQEIGLDGRKPIPLHQNPQ